MKTTTVLMLIALGALAALLSYGECCPQSGPYKREVRIKNCHERSGVWLDGKCVHVTEIKTD